MTLESTPPDATHLEHALDRPAHRDEPERREPDLAGLCTEARSETFKLSQDPLFIEKVRSIGGFISFRRRKP